MSKNKRGYTPESIDHLLTPLQSKKVEKTGCFARLRRYILIAIGSLVLLTVVSSIFVAGNPTYQATLTARASTQSAQRIESRTAEAISNNATKSANANATSTSRSLPTAIPSNTPLSSTPPHTNTNEPSPSPFVEITLSQDEQALINAVPQITSIDITSYFADEFYAELNTEAGLNTLSTAITATNAILPLYPDAKAIIIIINDGVSVPASYTYKDGDFSLVRMTAFATAMASQQSQRTNVSSPTPQPPTPAPTTVPPTSTAIPSNSQSLTTTSNITYQQKTVYAISQARLRSCPDTTCDEVAVLSSGSTIATDYTITGTDPFGAGNTLWYHTTYNNRDAFVYSGVVQDNAPSQAPAANTGNTGNNQSFATAQPQQSWQNQNRAAPSCQGNFDFSVCPQYLPEPPNCAEVVSRGIPERVAACCFPGSDGDEDGLACYGT